jgi:hypothetical protein
LVLAMLVTPVTEAGAATPQAWGFAYVDVPNATAWTELDHAHQWGSWKPSPQWAHGRRLGGVYQVRFPGIGLGSVGIVHVTAVGRDTTGTNNYCHAAGWYKSGADQIVEVKCQAPMSTAPTAVPFTVLWTVSPGLPFGPGSHAYVHKATKETFSSTAGAVEVNGNNPYLVKFSGIGNSVVAGNIQVTAVAEWPQALRCKVTSWGGTVNVHAFVACYDQNGALPPNADFVASYHEKRSVIGAVPFGGDPAPNAFGYLWCQNGLPTAFPTNYNSITTAPNSCSPYLPGRYHAQYNAIAVNETHYQVTATGPGQGPVSDMSSYCTIGRLWPSTDPVMTQVDCYDNTGTPVNNSFMTAFTSSRP